MELPNSSEFVGKPAVQAENVSFQEDGPDQHPLRDRMEGRLQGLADRTFFTKKAAKVGAILAAITAFCGDLPHEALASTPAKQAAAAEKGGEKADKTAEIIEKYATDGDYGQAFKLTWSRFSKEEAAQNANKKGVADRIGYARAHLGSFLANYHEDVSAVMHISEGTSHDPVSDEIDELQLEQELVAISAKDLAASLGVTFEDEDAFMKALRQDADNGFDKRGDFLIAHPELYGIFTALCAKNPDFEKVFDKDLVEFIHYVLPPAPHHHEAAHE